GYLVHDLHLEARGGGAASREVFERAVVQTRPDRQGPRRDQGERLRRRAPARAAPARRGRGALRARGTDQGEGQEGRHPQVTSTHPFLPSGSTSAFSTRGGPECQ